MYLNAVKDLLKHSKDGILQLRFRMTRSEINAFKNGKFDFCTTLTNEKNCDILVKNRI